MAYEFQVREDADGEDLHINVLLYGAPKSGKSTGAASAPGKVLYLNWDLPNATRFARRRPGNKGRLVEPVIPAFEPGRTPVFDLMTTAVLASHEGEWDTVVCDPLGELHRRLQEEQTNRSRRPTLDQRGNVATDIERWVRAMCEAPVNFVVVAHEMSDTKGDEGLVFMPFTGTKNGSQSGLGPKIAGMVDVIGYTAVVEVEDDPKPKYMAQLITAKGRQGGDRFAVLGTYRELDLAEWFALCGAHVAEANPSPK